MWFKKWIRTKTIYGVSYEHMSRIGFEVPSPQAQRKGRRLRVSRTGLMFWQHLQRVDSKLPFSITSLRVPMGKGRGDRGKCPKYVHSMPITNRLYYLTKCKDFPAAMYHDEIALRNTHKHQKDA